MLDGKQEAPPRDTESHHSLLVSNLLSISLSSSGNPLHLAAACFVALFLLYEFPVPLFSRPRLFPTTSYLSALVLVFVFTVVHETDVGFALRLQSVCSV